MLLKDKIAVITGGAGGIGLAATRIFADNGATVVILDIVEEAGKKIEKELTEKGYKALFIRTDISNEEQVKAAAAKIDKTFGRVDVLYNNASIFLGVGHKMHDDKMTELDSAIWDRVVHINLYGTYHCVKHIIPPPALRISGMICLTQ